MESLVGGLIATVLDYPGCLRLTVTGAARSMCGSDAEYELSRADRFRQECARGRMSPNAVIGRKEGPLVLPGRRAASACLRATWPGVCFSLRR
eukprot:541992-Alexandrium_andersonii.AAC.1